MLPKVFLQGRLTADPEMRITPNGKAVANFSVACNSRKPDGRGGWEDGPATFMRCTVWSEVAENVMETLHKADLVMVWGELEQQEWEQDGVRRTGFNVRVDEVGPTLRFSQFDKRERERQPAARDESGGAQSPYDEPPF